MLDEQRVERQPERLGKDPAQLLLGLLGRVGADDPQAVRQPVHMGVHGNRGDPVAEDEDAVRRLRPDARERRQLGERPGDLPVEAVEQGPGARPHGPGFRTVEADRADQHLDLAAAGRGQRADVREPGEQPGGGHVRLLVPRPLGKDRPDQDLERVFGMVAEVGGPPVAGPVERREPVEEELPVEGGRRRAGHPPVPRGRGAAARGGGAVSVPGSERSGSSGASRARRSSPMR